MKTLLNIMVFAFGVLFIGAYAILLTHFHVLDWYLGLLSVNKWLRIAGNFGFILFVCTLAVNSSYILLWIVNKVKKTDLVESLLKKDYGKNSMAKEMLLLSIVGLVILYIGRILIIANS